MGESNEKILQALREFIKSLGSDKTTVLDNLAACIPGNEHYEQFSSSGAEEFAVNFRTFLSSVEIEKVLLGCYVKDDVSPAPAPEPTPQQPSVPDAAEQLSADMKAALAMVSSYIRTYYQFWKKFDFAIPYYMSGNNKKESDSDLTDAVQIYADRFNANRTAVMLQSDPAYDAAFDFEKYTGVFWAGKANPLLIHYIVSGLMSGEVLKKGDRDLKIPEGPINTDYLKKYGIGVDCSGFASRGVSYVMRRFGMDKATQLLTLGKDGDALKSNATTLRVWGKTKGCERLLSFSYAAGSTSVTCTSHKGGKDKVISTKGLDFTAYLHPGDMILKVLEDKQTSDTPFHIWLIYDVQKDSFSAYNSTSVNQNGPVEKTYKSFQEFEKLVKNSVGQKKTNGDSAQLRVVFARPNAFLDDNLLKHYQKIKG